MKKNDDFGKVPIQTLGLQRYVFPAVPPLDTVSLFLIPGCIIWSAEQSTDHFGVVKAFLDEGLLPRVVTGTSAGGLIAALVGTRTDDELKRLIVPELANRITACEDPFSVWFKRFWTTGARFDSVAWARKVSEFVTARNHTYGCLLVVHFLYTRIDDIPRGVLTDRTDIEYFGNTC
jgi:hypothetical protein